MSDPHTPSPADPAPEHEPHGLVEEIRHEIEEVVEHVPEPVRWTVRQLVLLSVAAVFGIILIAIASVILYYMNRTEVAARELTLFLNNTLATRSNVRIEVSDIRGNPLKRVRLIHPRILFRDDGAPLLEAPWIDLAYSPLGLIGAGPPDVEIVAESPTLTLHRRPDGSLRLPTWRTSGGIGKPRHLDVHLAIRHGSVTLPGKDMNVRGLDLDALLSTGAVGQAVVRTLRWHEGPYYTRDLELAGQITAGDSVRFEVRRLATRDLSLSAEGGWKKGERSRRVRLTLDRCRWAWLAQVTGNNTFDVPGEAAGVVDAVGDSLRWSGDFTAQLDWNHLPLSGQGRVRWDGQQARVEPLVARSRAGELVGFATWMRAGWDVGGQVRGGEPSQWGALGIPGWPKGNMNGRFRYAVDTRRGVSDGVLGADIVNSELQGWRADSCRVDARLPARGTRTFDVLAKRRGGRFELHGQTHAEGWGGEYRVASLPLDEWPDGRASGIRGMLASGSGTVESARGGFSVTGDLAGESADWFGMHAARWKLASASGALLPRTNLDAAAALTDVTFLGVHFDSVGSPIRVGDRSLDLLDASARAGDTLLTLAGRADWDEKSWRLELARARAESRHFAWTAEPPVRFAGNAEGVTFERLEAHDGDAALKVHGRWAVPGGSYDWKAEARALDLARLGLPGEWGLGGRVDGTLSVQGISGNPRWSLGAETSAPTYGGHRGDSLHVWVEGQRGFVDLISGRLRVGAGTVDAHGRFAQIPRDWPDSLNGTAVMRWLETADNWRFVVGAHDFPLQRVTGLSPATAGWSGTLEGGLDISGSPERPVLMLNAQVSPLAWRDFSLQKLEAQLRYESGRLNVMRVRAFRDELDSSADGTIPLRLAFGRPPETLDQPMDVTLKVKAGDLKLLPLLVPQIASAAGRIEADAHLGGTTLHPDLEGSGRVTDGSLRMAGRDELLDHMQARFRMSRSTLTLDSLSARQGERGRVRSKGTVTLDGLKPTAYRFDLDLTECTASDPGLYGVQFDGKFVVADGPRVRGQWLPMVTGKASVRRAVILIDFAKQTEGEQLAASNPPLYWLYRIDVTAINNVHWQPPDGDIEFTTDLTAEQTPTELRLFGEMKAIRGTYYFLSNRFTVKRADLTFDDVSGVDPVVDAEATTHVVPLGTPGDVNAKTPQPHDVTVKITGRSREPQIAFESNPSDWDENDILRELTVGRFVSSQGVATGDPFDNYISRAINRTLSEEMSRAFRGYLNEWELDREQGGLFSGQGEVFLGVGSQLTPNLMLRYRQRVPGLGREGAAIKTGAAPFERDLEAEYRLNRLFLMTSEVAQRRSLSGSTTTTASTPDFNINLKARWEY